MDVVHQIFGNWETECMPLDGGRISALRYKGFNLLTCPSSVFEIPENDYGEYETRPVYGYDDCFPSVNSCEHPTLGFQIRDHGDLCWLKWQAEVRVNILHCYTLYDKFGIQFNRTLEFKKNTCKWKFDIVNLDERKFEFLHVVHPLMPLSEIAGIELPNFENARITESFEKGADFNLTGLSTFLMNIEPGNFEMLYLRNFREGKVVLHFKNGMKLQIMYNPSLFPTFGIWWNNSGYPEEPGLERCECAFEPIPGISDDLMKTYNAQQFLIVEPGKTFSWEYTWLMES